MECTLYWRKTARSKWVPLVWGWANDERAAELRRAEAVMHSEADGCEWKWFITDGFDRGSKWLREMGKEL